MKEKTYAFKNENGDLINYNVKEYLSINQNDYVVMCPENNTSQIEVYKFHLENGNEYLDIVDNKAELDKVKASSKVI
ncbi:DUF1292 domain-containing protein [Clostridium sp. MSJ-4]|uniref:DUF1292 domain-containing protein n=1 Tax=Clostridium simiarum TaxID=2841506 RepID=A0ABS6F651_9CLOT|nr:MULTISPECIES: DUF1292 domain-containing protein [Clostridium]MBU5593300.1 DUF1292 domain-containing protein [Clostridium simiarum]